MLTGETAKIKGLRERFEKEIGMKMKAQFGSDCAQPTVTSCPLVENLSPLMVAEETRFTFYKVLDSVITQEAYDTYGAEGVLSRCL